jgi:hypothetical protein
MPHRNKNMLLSSSFIIIAIIIASCTLIGPDKSTIVNDEFRIIVDSARFSSGIYTFRDTVVIQFYGKIGSDSCFKFSHFQEHFESNSLELALWGKKDASSGNCNSGNVDLSGQQYRLYPVQTGFLNVTIRQPDGSTILTGIRIY